MTSRNVAGFAYQLTYDGDNRLVENRVVSTAAPEGQPGRETYRYDGDGKLI